MLAEEVQNKWKPVLEHADLPTIESAHKRAVTAQILENTENALREDAQNGQSQQLLDRSNRPYLRNACKVC